MKRAKGSLMRLMLGCLAVIVIGSGICGCGGSEKGEGSGGSPRVLSSSEAKHLLLQLPYRYTWRQVDLPEGASGALAGKAIGQHHTIIHFGIALGEKPKPVPVPKAGVSGAFYYLGAGFVFTDDLIIPGSSRVGEQFQTEAQWKEAATMEVQMEEAFCREVTHEPCQM
jgi:hypothetical protein